jgi:GT2 family glycosyltransferase
MDVSIIIVNYNSAEVVQACVDSVLKQIGVEFELIIIDNASSDHSATTLESLQSNTHIQILLNQENIGFGRANNQAFQRCCGRYVFLLNPDAVLLAPDDLQRLVTFMDGNPRCGLAGTRIWKGGAGQENLPVYFYPGEKSLQQKLHALPGKIAWVLGASMIIRREIYESVRGFDEGYFLYAEEADLCLRIRQRGYVIEQCTNVAVRHIGGVSESSAPIEHVQRKKQAGLYLFYKKHYPADEVVRLVRRDRARAMFQLLPLVVQKYCGCLSEPQSRRYHKYRAVYETAKAFLRAEADNKPAVDFNVL